jgi:3-oxoacyl-[acyl-carrier protein] reductase
MTDLAGAVAVVTGAGQGIGRSVAVLLAARGAVVAVSDVDSGLAESVAGEIVTTGGRAVALVADVADEDDVARLGRTTKETLGDITVWINNAGVTRPAMLYKMEVAEFDLVLRVHARGTFLGIREAARHMIASGVQGSIINVTSSAGLQGTIGQINYSAAKGAVTSMTKSAAKELARYGIRVNAVAPVAATPMTENLRTNEKLTERFLAQIPLGRFAEADEVADAFLYLASRQAAYITGQVLCIDGGLYMAS